MKDYDWKSFSFGSGSHDTRKDGMCVMEAVAYVAGEPHSDHPSCACPVLSAFCRAWNDGLESDKERAKWLGEFVWRLPGTKAGAEIELRRSEMALDWLIRVFTPAYLRLVPSLISHAEDLESLPEIGCSNLDIIAPILQSTRDAAWDAARSAAGSAAWSAARSAAGFATRSAAWDAARSAAWDAARDAARSAAWSAAWSAARSAAWSAAGSAAWSALRDRTEQLKQPARDLLDRMVRLTEIAEKSPVRSELERKPVVAQ